MPNTLNASNYNISDKSDAAEKIIVSADNLSKIFKDKKTQQKTIALSNLNFKIAAGKITALIGPDSAGKTTLIRIIAALTQPSVGEISVLGMNPLRSAQKIQSSIGYMPQKFGLYEDLSVMENMNLYADMHGVSKNARSERFSRLLEMADLSAFTNRLAGKLSGGMKQKLGLICALVRSPDLLLLDEPTVGVDPLSRRELWDILLHLVESERLSVLVSTAYMDEAALCSDILVLHKGKLLTQGPPEVLLKKARGLCYKIIPPAGIPARLIQSSLLNNKNVFADAVPDGGCIRFIKRPEASERSMNDFFAAFNAKSNLNLKPMPAKERVEDGFMALLNEHERGAQQSAAAQPDSFLPPAAYIGKNDIVIETRNLVRKFGDFTAVADTSFQVRRGEIFGLLGPNGAGKTTTFRMLCGLLPASGGYISVAGVNLLTARTQARAKIGYVAQLFSLYGNLSVMENLEFFGRIYGLNSSALKTRIAAVKKQFSLEGWEKTPAGALPGGFKQRLSMAAALLHEPEILFLDEPTSGIDPLARRLFWQQITAFAAAGTTIIITTHFMEEAEYCDRIMIQDRGKMLAIGAPQEIRERVGRNNPAMKNASMNEIFIEAVKSRRN